MTKHLVRIACWQHGHISELGMTLKQEEKLGRQIPKMLAVCPKCTQLENGNMPIVIVEGRTVNIHPAKCYTCRHGHLTSIAGFKNGMLHIRYGLDDSVNVEGTIEELPELLDSKDVACNHTTVGKTARRCVCKLNAIDDTTLVYPEGTNFKTKTRVGDIWDSANLEPVRPGTYDRDGHFKISKTDNANRERLKRMRRNRRNTSVDRQPGERIDKATDTDYGHKTKTQLPNDSW